MIDEANLTTAGRKEIGIFYNPWPAEFEPKKSVSGLYRRALWFKANPRSEEYMRALFRERSPDGIFVDIQKDENWPSQVAAADSIFLLYPDATGLYFSQLESDIEKDRKEWATVRVLNGRRRAFVLSRTVRRRLRLRRFIERTMLGEALFSAAFLAVTPFFLVSDLVRGRR